MTIIEKLLALQDLQYQRFQQQLIPNIPSESVIGVRVPALKSLAKELQGTKEAEEFLCTLPHPYYDENMLHCMLLNRESQWEKALEQVEAFLPYVDNWAVSDGLFPIGFRDKEERLQGCIEKWMAGGHVYSVRFGTGMLMRTGLDQLFTPEVLEKPARIYSEEYYIRMMIAWFYATALAKHYPETLAFLRRHQLHPWVHNKAIQKALESNRISPEEKQELRAMKRGKEQPCIAY